MVPAYCSAIPVPSSATAASFPVMYWPVMPVTFAGAEMPSVVVALTLARWP